MDKSILRKLEYVLKRYPNASEEQLYNKLGLLITKDNEV